MTASSFTRQTILDALLRDTPFAGISEHWVGIWTGNPATTGAEVQASEYGRVAVTFSDLFENDVEVLFDVALSTWGTLAYLVVVDQQTGGNILGWATGSGDPIAHGIQPRIAVGNLDWNLT